MSTASFAFSPRWRDDLVASLLGIYAVKLDALLYAVNHSLAERTSLDAVVAHRSELAAVGQLIDQLGWAFAPHWGGRPTTVVGDLDLLREAVRGLVRDALAVVRDAVEEPSGVRTDLAHRLRAIAEVLELGHQLGGDQVFVANAATTEDQA
jgi:hypothetical protein